MAGMLLVTTKLHSQQFPRLLRYLAEHRGYQYSTIAQEAGLHAPDVSKMASGDRVVGQKVFAKLINGIKHEDRHEAITAWLNDQMPEGADDYVHIVNANLSFVQENHLPDPNTLEGAVALLAKRAQRSPALAEAIMALAKCYQ